MTGERWTVEGKYSPVIQIPGGESWGVISQARFQPTEETLRATQHHATVMALAPELEDMLFRIWDAEFGFGIWPDEKAIVDLLERAGRKPPA